MRQSDEQTRRIAAIFNSPEYDSFQVTPLEDGSREVRAYWRGALKRVFRVLQSGTVARLVQR